MHDRLRSQNSPECKSGSKSGSRSQQREGLCPSPSRPPRATPSGPHLNTWIDTADLTTGQYLQTSAGTRIQITAITQRTTQATVHNLTVAGTHTYYVLAGDTPVLVHNVDGACDWVAENASKSGPAQDYEDGAIGARSRVSTQTKEVPALDYINLVGDTRQVRFDGFDEGNGVLIDRKLGIRTQEKTRRAAINQSMALEQNGYTGLWEVANQRAANRATRMFGRLGITNIDVRVVAP
ncbi:polymorphic toxin-type HINT domain-containing protein [Streptomyces albidoflavus]|uniref:polymorphic toxin-type HINT domain-containing protein n=1 Tax=Streptomyces albidoflavus TaxID=1886 RepID=UPI0033AB36B3